MSFDESEELRALRAAVAELGPAVRAVLLPGAGPLRRAHRRAVGRGRQAGFLGVNLPEEYGGGGGGMVELSIVLEELGAAGCPLLMMVVSPAICGTVIARFGTDEQKQRWLPGLADGSFHHGLRDHRARRRLELARDHHHGARRPRRLGADAAGRC